MTSPLIELLVRELRVSEREVLHLISTAPDRYKVYTIPKRNGGRREIAQPARELKVAQRAIMSEYLSALPVHDAAYAYVKGQSIKDNAEYHAGIGPILKYDFKDFFPSITEFAWLSYCERHKLMSKEDAVRSGRILFRRPKGGSILRLSVGAPSSPMLSNILLYDFDTKISDMVSKHKIKYTRYADDLALLWHIFADHSSPFSATVRACGRRRLTKLGQDRLSYGWQAWLRRRARTSFFSALLP